MMCMHTSTDYMIEKIATYRTVKYRTVKYVPLPYGKRVW
jgi:hypothetical protein